MGLLPNDYGHHLGKRLIGRSRRGKGLAFKTSPTAAYPEGMCEYIAKTIFTDWIGAVSRSPSGMGKPSLKMVRLLPRVTEGAQEDVEETVRMDNITSGRRFKDPP